MSVKPLSLISINIENSKHISFVGTFLTSRDADIVCLQEVLESTFVDYKNKLQMHGRFCPMTIRKRDDSGIIEPEGVAVLSKHPIIENEGHYYRGDANNLKNWDKSTLQSLMETVYAVLSKCTISLNGEIFTIITTHFTWTPDGQPNEYQKEILKR